MNPWKITWWDGGTLRETIIPPTDAFNLVNAAANCGVSCYTILKMERIGS